MTRPSGSGAPRTGEPARSGLPLRTRAMYGLGETAEGIKTAALETFLFFYYVQVVGLSGTLTGLALFVALLFDGLTDPMVGAWSDRTRTRLGRRHPYLYAAPLPLALALFGLFQPPALPQAGLFLWLVGFAVGARFAMTLYFVPHMALGADLSRDFEERVAIGGWRTLFGYLGRVLALFLAFSVFFAARDGDPNGQLDRAAYPPFALTLGVLVIVFVLASALGTQRAALARSGAAVPDHASGGVWRTLQRAAAIPSIRALWIALLIMYLYNGVQFALALHMNTYFWRLPPQQLQFVFYATTVGFILGIPLARPLANRWDKKPVYMAGVAGSCVLGSLPTLLRLCGAAPPNGAPELFHLLVGCAFGLGFVGALPVVLSAAMLADASDEYDVVHGGRTEGLFFGVNAFCRKASLGLGGAVAGLIVDLVRFPAHADPAAVPPEAMTRLGIAYAPVMLAVLFTGLACMIPYDLSRRRHADIVHALARRRTTSASIDADLAVDGPPLEHARSSPRPQARLNASE
ncbi:MFS transporter [Phenylobacterium sp.]|uniref:MFS transporter n=1 Tax=Phenylobacterium sp. TaxID=1871053 RepID=UPI0025E2C2C0|nr:MFS transporter [Phenylobacterium sp.]